MSVFTILNNKNSRRTKENLFIVFLFLPIKDKNTLNTIEGVCMLRVILIVFLILLLVGAFPAWPHSQSWGYYPFSGLGLVLLIIIILIIAGVI